MKIIDVEMQNRSISNVIFQFLSADFLNSSITSFSTIFYALLFFFGGGDFYALHWFIIFIRYDLNFHELRPLIFVSGGV